MRKFLEALNESEALVLSEDDESLSICEEAIPETEYGYWITDTGKFLVVGDHDHAGVARRNGMDSYNACYAAGWIRLVCLPDRATNGATKSLLVRFDSGNPPMRAISSLRRLASRDFTSFTVDIGGDEWQYKSFTEFRPFYAFVAEHRQIVGALTEAEDIPDTEYGYWITPDGEFISVPYQSHGDVIRSHTKLAIASKWDALEQGWIRIISAVSLSVEMAIGKPSIRAVTALRRLINSKHYTEFSIEAEDNDGGATYKSFTTPVPFYNYAMMLRRASSMKQMDNLQEGQIDEAEVPDTTYGYWIKPDGDIVVVEFESHLSTLSAISDFRRYKQAFVAGWIRLIADRDLAIQFGDAKPPMRAMSALRKIANSKEFGKFYIDVSVYSDENGELINRISKDFTEIGAAMATCMQHRGRAKQPMTESRDVADLVDGCWIDADGEILHCDRDSEFHHADIAGQYFNNEEDEFDDEDEDSDVEQMMDDDWDNREAWMDAAFEHHWIRVGSMGNVAYAEMRGPSPDALKTLKAAAGNFDDGFDTYTLHTGSDIQNFPDLRSFRVAIARL